MLQTFNEKNRDLVVYIAGRLGHRDEMGVSPFDSVVQGGDAVWEGLRLYEGRIFKLSEHLKRLRHSAKAMAFADIPDDAFLIDAIRQTLSANKMWDGVHIRLTLTRGVKITSGMDPRLNQSGSTLIVLAEHKPPVYDKGGIRLITSGIRRIPPDCVDQKIHSANLINSILAKIQANAAGVDDALMLDMRGFVAETNATHLFLVIDGTLVTSHCGSCPEGVTRKTVIGLAHELGIPLEVRDITVSEVYRADELFCTGTMGEIVAVDELDGRTIGSPGAWGVANRISQAFRELTKTQGTIVVEPE